MKKTIYLPNNSKTLKQYSIEYNYDEILNYINSKTMEMGAKVDNYGSINPSYYHRIIADDERLSVKRVYHSKLDIGTIWKNPNLEYNYEIFSNEAPIIRALTEVLKPKKTCLGKINDANTIGQYLLEKHSGMTIEQFFDYNYFEHLSFAPLIKYLKNKDIMLEFLEFFKLDMQDLFSYSKLENSTFQAIDCFHNQYPNAKIEILDYAKKEFEKVKKISKNNQKVLRLK